MTWAASRAGTKYRMPEKISLKSLCFINVCYTGSFARGVVFCPISNRDGLSYGKALNLSSAVRQTARGRLRDRRRCFHDEVASHNIQRFDLFYQLLEFVDRFDGTYPDPVQRGHH